SRLFIRSRPLTTECGSLLFATTMAISSNSDRKSKKDNGRRPCAKTWGQGPAYRRPMADQTQKWPNHVVLVRHGESERNIHKEIAEAQGELVYGGDIRDVDVPLTDRGSAQAIATGKALSQMFQFNRIFVSPFVRTHQTADIINQQFAIPV